MGKEDLLLQASLLQMNRKGGYTGGCAGVTV
jgi:hypothetical protein